jgi:hypothetical protein
VRHFKQAELISDINASDVFYIPHPEVNEINLVVVTVSITWLTSFCGEKN